MTEEVDPQFEKLFLHLGRLAFCWAQLDFALAGMVYSIFHEHGNPAKEAEPPRALDRRLKFLRKSLRLLIADERILNEWLEIFRRIGEESVTRNQLLHGAVESTGETLEATSIFLGQSETELRKSAFSFDALSAASDRTSEITIKVQTATQGLLRLAREGNG